MTFLVWEPDFRPRSCSSAAGAFPFGLCYFRPMSRTFLYRCPNTGQNVQGWSADEVTDDDDTYQSVECVACTRVHLVNVETGKVLGEDED